MIGTTQWLSASLSKYPESQAAPDGMKNSNGAVPRVPPERKSASIVRNVVSMLALPRRP